MNLKQKIIIVITGILIVGICLYPPWIITRYEKISDYFLYLSKKLGIPQTQKEKVVIYQKYDFIWSSAKDNRRFMYEVHQIDLKRLLIEIVIVLALGISLALVFKESHPKSGK